MDPNPVPYQQQRPQQSRKSASSGQALFEFTKRKRWDNLLLSEVHLTLVLVLSIADGNTPSKILFTGYNTAFTDVLGYNEGDLIGSDFSDIVDHEDWPVWQNIVNEAVRMETSTSVSMFIRLKRKPGVVGSQSSPDANWPPVLSPAEGSSEESKEGQPAPVVLFELCGCVHFIDSPGGMGAVEPACVMATATPYPSTANDSLNGLLEQKVEHQRLLKRMRELMVLDNSAGSSGAPALTQPFVLGKISTSVADPTAMAPSHQPDTQPMTPADAGFPQASTGIINHVDFSGAGAPATSLGIRTATMETGDQGEGESSRPHKIKKDAMQHVCVTCGRIDSPEWRRGPQGPKTLCNACGLRWAKKSRKVDE